jgi:lactobin A/cerein 7B family class IIb bacteriocin
MIRDQGGTRMAFEHAQIRSLDDREIDQVEGGLSPVTLGVAAAVVGVWVAAFQAGYALGKDLAS